MEYPKGKLNTVKRGAQKAKYDKATIHSILDATEVCHIAFIYDGKPFVQPINFGRKGDKIYIHGSHKNRMTQALIDSEELCLSVMLLDALKLTRSAFHHSVNYRSAMIFGSAKELTGNEEKLDALKSIINHFVPNRWEHCRLPDEKELKATRVLEIEIESASAKVADTPPKDNNSDLSLDFWGGTIPTRIVYGEPKHDQHVKDGTPIPEHLLEFVKTKNDQA